MIFVVNYFGIGIYEFNIRLGVSLLYSKYIFKFINFVLNSVFLLFYFMFLFCFLVFGIFNVFFILYSLNCTFFIYFKQFYLEILYMFYFTGQFFIKLYYISLLIFSLGVFRLRNCSSLYIEFFGSIFYNTLISFLLIITILNLVYISVLGSYALRVFLWS